MSNVFKNRNIILDLPKTICAEGLSPAQAKASGSRGSVAQLGFNEAAAAQLSVDDQTKIILEQASASGSAKGFDEGFKLGIDESVSRIGRKLTQIDIDLKKESERILTENQADCMQLRGETIPVGLKIAAFIIHSQLKNDENAFINLFENAASHISETDAAVLNVGPLGYEIAARHVKEFEASIKGVKKFTVRLSGSNNGLCVIETPFGSIDASADTQIEKAARTLGIPV